MGPLHFNWSVSVADLVAILLIVGTATRYIVNSLRSVLHRMDLHEEALITAGWLRKNQFGDLEVPRRYQYREVNIKADG